MNRSIDCDASHRSTLLDRKVYATFCEGEGFDLAGLCLELLTEQKKTWQDLREGYEAFKEVRERDLPCTGFSVRLQHNLGRIKSSAAITGANTDERNCFLCLDHLPQDQKGILYRGDYLILCNPRPIFSHHFTVTHLDHRRQAIAGHTDTLLQLASDFGPAWTVLYNGPRCGASAPDHMHLQITPSGQMPIEKEIKEERRRSLAMRMKGVFLYRLQDLGREAILLEGGDPVAVGVAFKRLAEGLKNVLLIDEEPMINVMGCWEEGRWHLVVFPRRRHRPDVFFREGDARMVVSPGVIDMGGVLVTPREKDFKRLDAAWVKTIFGEVSMDGETIERTFRVLAG